MAKRQIKPNQQPCSLQDFQQFDISQYLCDHSQQQLTQKNKVILPIKNEDSEQLHQPFLSQIPVDSNLSEQARSNYISPRLPNLQSKQFNSEIDPEDSSERNRKDSSKNKIYAKNYRQKKKQKLKSLQEENRFLKSKIDDLSFRLKQTQLELNKLKHNHPLNTQNFQTSRESILKQIQNIIEKEESTNIQNLLQVQKKLKGMNAFDSKYKKDLLNYFMNELLENLINDFGFYFIDCLIEKKGFWKSYDNSESRRIDREIAELMGQQDFEQMTKTIRQFPQLALAHMRNFKTLWKKLYDDYINIINQGLMIQSLCRHIEDRNNKQNCKKQVLNYFKLELYFEKIKYRKDMRQLRESWFHQLSFQQQQAKSNRTKNANKKIKLTS